MPNPIRTSHPNSALVSKKNDNTEASAIWLNEANLRDKKKPIISKDACVRKKELKKRDKKTILTAQAAEPVKQDVLVDDPDAFTVVIGCRTSLLNGQDQVDAMFKDITIDNFSVSAWGRELLKNASFKISHGKCYGLVGPSGTGKSTLLKLLAWRKIPVPQNLDVHLVEQEVSGDDTTALAAVVSANEDLIKNRQEVELTLQNQDDDADGKLVELYEKTELMGSDAAEAHASKILGGLGFTIDMQGRPTRSFCGGWRMRISLARALFVQPTLLLLDEPTNYLDLRAVIWLEEYLSRWKKTLLVVSHDREFLNSVCDEIIHLHDLKLHLYHGNFDDFERGYEQRRKDMNMPYDIACGPLRRKAPRKSLSRTQLDRVATQLSNSIPQSRLFFKKPEKVTEAPKMWSVYTVKFHFPELPELRKSKLLQLDEVNFCYPNQEDFKLSEVSVGVDMGTRVAIVGPHGAGKSTLLNLLAGDLVPTEGLVQRCQNLRIGKYSQHFVDLLTMEETPVQYLLRLHPDLTKAEDVRAKLGRYGLPKHNHLASIAKLSGGQKARVVFASISIARPHILLLDEPTNHLDMESIDALADALDEYAGGVVLVGQDSRLISRVCANGGNSEIWLVQNGTVEKRGSFEEYKEELQTQIRFEIDS